MEVELWLVLIGALGVVAAGMARARGRNPAVWYLISLVGFFFAIPYLLTQSEIRPHSSWEVRTYYAVSALIVATTAFIVVHGSYVAGIF